MFKQGVFLHEHAWKQNNLTHMNLFSVVNLSRFAFINAALKYKEKYFSVGCHCGKVTEISTSTNRQIKMMNSRLARSCRCYVKKYCFSAEILSMSVTRFLQGMRLCWRPLVSCIQNALVLWCYGDLFKKKTSLGLSRNWKLEKSI